MKSESPLNRCGSHLAQQETRTFLASVNHATNLSTTFN